jgi:hypothetical protein
MMNPCPHTASTVCPLSSSHDAPQLFRNSHENEARKHDENVKGERSTIAIQVFSDHKDGKKRKTQKI